MVKKNVMDKIVDGGPAYKIAAHCSFGQYVVDKLREYSQSTRPGLINADNGAEFTFKQMLQETVNVATGLRKINVKKGDVIGFCSESRPQYIASVVAAACCGAVVTAANVQYMPDEMTHVLNISRPTIMFCSEAVMKKNYNLFKSLPFIKTFVQYDGIPVDADVISYNDVCVYGDAQKFEAEPVEGWKDTVFILYSSGTTGFPKGVMLTHLNALYEVAIVEHDTGVYDEIYSMYLTVVPWYHAYGLMSTINYMICNRTMVYLTAFHPEKYLNAIQKYKGEIPSDWIVVESDKEVLSVQCPASLQGVREEDIVVWVDPLDGTSEYTQGALMLKRDPWERWKMYLTHPFISMKWYLSLLQSNYGFLEHVTVLIGISVNEKPVAGVIHQPYYKTLVGGEKKMGRTIWGLQGAGVGGYTPAPPPDSLVITTTRSHSNPVVEQALQVMNASQILRVGGAGYKVLQLLEGKASVYVFASPGCKKWDTCAPEAILAAAGGKLTDILGEFYKYGASVSHPNKTGVLAAVNDELHTYALNKIPQELKDRLAKK